MFDFDSQNRPAPEKAVPFTDAAFLNDENDFHFAVISDRGGAERPGIFGKTMDALNLLRPEFTICVGDLMEGVLAFNNDKEKAENEIVRQSDEVEEFIGKLDMKFFYVVGNHDINLGWPDNHIAYDVSKAEWLKRHGSRTYYDFMYKNCHFVCLDSMEGRDGRIPVDGITSEQYDWAVKTIKEHRNCRWTFIFMHMPIDWTSDKFMAFEREINDQNYTVFCGDWHNHIKAVRHGKNYYMLGTSGGCFEKGFVHDDLRRGLMDAVTWVTVTDNGPVVANLQLSGIYNDDIQRCATSTGWLETSLDYPDHYTIADGLDAEGTGDGSYDWHFRHAMIQRNGDLLIKPDIVIAGDDIIHKWGSMYWMGDESYPRPPELETPFFRQHRVLNMGFIGDKCENLLWRIRHGEMEDIAPEYVILHIGSENLKAGDSALDTACAIQRNIQAIHAAVPGAAIKLLLPLDDVPHREELGQILTAALSGDGKTEILDLADIYRKDGCAGLEDYFLSLGH